MNETKKKTAVVYNSVRKCFNSRAGRITAVDDVSLSIDQGQFVTIVGPTGCGKTTLLNITAGHESLDSGQVKVNRSQIAYVFQHYPLLPWRNVLGNVCFGLQMRKVPRKERIAKAKSILEKVGLSEFEKAWTWQLSGGMKQRVAIAQALATEPDVLLMDEPFGAVDDATRGQLQQMLIDLHRAGGLTVVFVTHSIDEAILLGNRVLVFEKNGGRIVEDIEINLPQPRDKTSSGFVELFLRVRNVLANGFQDERFCND